MSGCQTAPAQLSYDFCLDDHGPTDHLLRGIDRHLDLDSVRAQLKPFYSSTGRPSVDPELMMRMLIVGYRSEEHTSELQSLMRISYAVFCLKKKKIININTNMYNKQNDTINSK